MSRKRLDRPVSTPAPAATDARHATLGLLVPLLTDRRHCPVNEGAHWVINSAPGGHQRNQNSDRSI